MVQIHRLECTTTAVMHSESIDYLLTSGQLPDLFLQLGYPAYELVRSRIQDVQLFPHVRVEVLHGVQHAPELVGLGYGQGLHAQDLEALPWLVGHMY